MKTTTKTHWIKNTDFNGNKMHSQCKSQMDIRTQTLTKFQTRDGETSKKTDPIKKWLKSESNMHKEHALTHTHKHIYERLEWLRKRWTFLQYAFEIVFSLGLCIYSFNCQIYFFFGAHMRVCVFAHVYGWVCVSDESYHKFISQLLAFEIFNLLLEGAFDFQCSSCCSFSRFLERVFFIGFMLYSGQVWILSSLLLLLLLCSSLFPIIDHLCVYKHWQGTKC